jgi:signal transduction histidine kinase
VTFSRPSPPVLVDAALAAIALAASLALVGRHVGSLQPERGQLDWIGGALIACSTLPIVVWRRAPRPAFALTASASVLLGALGYSIGLPVGPTVALYLFAASRDDTDPWSRRDTGTVMAFFAAFLGASAFSDGGFPASELFHTGLAWSVAWFAGERTRLRREQLADLEERALRADRDRERERRLALAEERARIARDLHDSVGHAINLIAVRAGAARLRRDEDPERSFAALVAIEEVARQTAGEIDQIVGTLREPGAEHAAITAPLGLASLETLVAHHAASGLDATVAIAGSPRPLASALDLAAYRILQEALTNAARHGTGAAQVELMFGDAELELTITNLVRDPGRQSANGGHGLIGMRERTTLLGGTLDVERHNGTFLLRGRLPYGGRRL